MAFLIKKMNKTIKKTVLHVGCGCEEIHPLFKDFAETRLDIDPRHNPDIIACMTGLGDIGPFDAVYSCHCLEHLDERDALLALKEFNRVLNVGGFCFILVPDIENVKQTDEVILQAPCGGITGNDMHFGHHEFIKTNPYMRHLSQFTKDSLMGALVAAGFSECFTKRLLNFNLFGIGTKREQ